MLKLNSTTTKITICLLFATIAIHVKAAYSAPAEFVNSIQSHSKTMLQKGDFHSSLDDTAQALLIDPHNTENIEALVGLLESSELPSKYKILLYQFRDLQSINSRLKYEIDVLESNLVLLKKRLIVQGLDKEFLDSQLVKIEKTRPGYKPLEQLSNFNTDSLLEEVNNILASDKDYLMNIKDVMLRQYSDLISIKNDYALNQNKASNNSDQHLQKYYTKEGKLLHKNHTIAIVKSKENEISEAEMLRSLKSEITQAQIKYDVVLGMLDSKDQRIEKMQKDIVDLTIKVAENQTIFETKDEELVKLKAEIDEVQARFVLGQEIIKSKTQEIADLKDNILNLKSEYEIEKNATEVNLREEYELKLSLKDVQIHELEKTISENQGIKAKVERDLIELSNYITSKENEILELKDTIRKNEEEQSMNLFEIDRKNSYIDDLKSDLAKLRLEIENKNISISSLRNNLKIVQGQIDKQLLAKTERREEKIGEHKDEIRILKDQFKNLQGARESDRQKIESLVRSLEEKKSQLHELQMSQLSLKKDILDKNISNETKEILKNSLEVDAKSDSSESMKAKKIEYNDDLLDAQNEITDLTLKLERNQGKLLQKDDKIKELNADILVLTASNERIEANYKEAQERIVSLEKNVIDLMNQASVNDVESTKIIESQLKDIKILNQKLQEKDKIIKNKSDEIVKINDDLTVLQKQFLNKDLEIEKLRSIHSNAIDSSESASKNRQIHELKGILAIYKEELAEAKNEVRKNVANISTLEEQLTLVQTELFEKDETLRQTESRFKGMEYEIEELKKELELLRSLRNQASINSPELLNLTLKLAKLESQLNLERNSKNDFTFKSAKNLAYIN